MKKVLVGGAFNSLHPGHEFFLNKAREYGNYVIVVVATDRTVMKNKGYLIKDQEARKKDVEELDIADRVIIGDDENFLSVVAAEKPDIIVLGYDQSMDKVLEKKILDMGIEVKRMTEKFGDYSTSELAHVKKNKIS